MNKSQYSKIRWAFGIALLGALTGCVGYVDHPHHASGYGPPPTVYVQSGVVVQDDYVYYPGYQVYYSSNRRQYVYLDRSAWVTRPDPPRVSVDVLFASPSVRLDFHDAPSSHHASVAQQYPKNWAPPGAKSNHGQDKKSQGKGKGQWSQKND